MEMSVDTVARGAAGCRSQRSTNTEDTAGQSEAAAEESGSRLWNQIQEQMILTV